MMWKWIKHKWQFSSPLASWATPETNTLGFGSCPFKASHPGRITYTQPHVQTSSVCVCVSLPLNKVLRKVSPSFLPAITTPSTTAPMTCFLLCTELLALLMAPLLVQSCTYWRILWFFQVFVTFHSSEWNMDSFKWTKWHVLLINDRYSKRGKRPCIHYLANSAHFYDQYLISANLVSKKRVLFTTSISVIKKRFQVAQW